MEKGSDVFRALKQGDMALILLRLVDLAYCALNAIVEQGGESCLQKTIDWRPDGSVLSVMRLVSEHLNSCVSGDKEAYVALYSVCAQLSSRFLNADFATAFLTFHQHVMHHAPPRLKDEVITGSAHLHKPLDMSECLFE